MHITKLLVGFYNQVAIFYLTTHVCVEQEVDGDIFMGLEESHLEKIIPNKLGVVRKIMKLRQEVCFTIAFLL